MRWVSRIEYDYVHDALLRSEEEWERALSKWEWLKEKSRDEGVEIVLKKFGDKVVEKGFGAYLAEFYDVGKTFLFGSRDDIKANKEKFQKLRLEIESYWNNPCNRYGDYGLFPVDYIMDVPVVSFPEFWHIWSDWLPF